MTISAATYVPLSYQGDGIATAFPVTFPYQLQTDLVVQLVVVATGLTTTLVNGTDYADSFANQQGFKLASAYNFTDFLTITATFYDTWDYKKGLYQSLGGGTASPNAQTASTLNLVGEKSDERVQVDLGWKF